MIKSKSILNIALMSVSIFCKNLKAEETIRVGFFPNVTHAQPLLGLANGTFQKHIGSDVKIQPYQFNAGPSAIEALFAGSLDVAYIGPSPAINAFIKSNGEGIRIISGSASGGASLIVQSNLNIKNANDLKGKIIATPQLGNTQDVAARSWLTKNNLKIKTFKEEEGDVLVSPIKNADQLTLFQRGEIQAAWAVEPWASRLIHEAKGSELFDEKTLWENGMFSTTVLVTTPEFMKKHKDILKKWLKAHVEITNKIQKISDEDKEIINEEIKKITGKDLSPIVLNRAFSKINFTTSPVESSIQKSAENAFNLGLLGSNFLFKKAPDLKGLVDMSLLDEVTKNAEKPNIAKK